MDRSLLRAGLENILNFLQTEEQSYQECLNRYLSLINTYKKIFLFGGGEHGLCAVSILKERLSDKKFYFIDNDTKKQGLELCKGVECFGIEKLKECDPKDSCIIITSINGRNEIYSLLSRESRINDKILSQVTILKDFGFLFCKTDYEDRHQDKIWQEYIKHKIDILNVFDMLEDEESCFIYYRIFVNRITRKDTFGELFSPNQYFIPEVCELLDENEVFLDCGSYIGETFTDFKRHSENKFIKSYEFELDAKNFKELSKNIPNNDDRVILVNAGVGSEDSVIEYAQFQNRGGSCGFAFTEHDVKIGACRAVSRIKKIDSMIANGEIQEKITLVKMDIEGAEMEALKGMANMIERDIPKLAICIYHRPQDMWEIPLYVHKLVPSYKIIIRHHDFFDNETVLYALNKLPMR